MIASLTIYFVIPISPYYYGEGVFVTDNGGLYLWDIESGYVYPIN